MSLNRQTPHFLRPETNTHTDTTFAYIYKIYRLLNIFLLLNNNNIY
jgi:hypothetical protein